MCVYVQNQLGVSLLLAGSVSWDPPTAETGQLLILNGAATGWGNTSSSHDFLSWAWVISYAYAIVQCVDIVYCKVFLQILSSASLTKS